MELVECQPLLEWLANNYKNFGATLEIITDKSQEGSQFVRGFGGIGGQYLQSLFFLVLYFRFSLACLAVLIYGMFPTTWAANFADLWLVSHVFGLQKVKVSLKLESFSTFKIIVRQNLNSNLQSIQLYSVIKLLFKKSTTYYIN